MIYYGKKKSRAFMPKPVSASPRRVGYNVDHNNLTSYLTKVYTHIRYLHSKKIVDDFLYYVGYSLLKPEIGWRTKIKAFAKNLSKWALIRVYIERLEQVSQRGEGSPDEVFKEASPSLYPPYNPHQDNNVSDLDKVMTKIAEAASHVEEKLQEYNEENENSTKHISVFSRLSENEMERLFQMSSLNGDDITFIRQFLSSLSIKEPTISLDKVIINDETRALLMKTVTRAKHQEELVKMGIRPSLIAKETGGAKVLLYGESGVGKTLLVEAMCNALNAELLVVDSAALSFRLMGETQKNIKRLFTIYSYLRQKNRKQGKELVMVINEADQIFSKRLTEIRQAVDDEKNSIQNVLLESLEDFQGFLMCTTNLVELFDDAWVRRFNIKVKIPFPTKEERRKIWMLHLPPEEYLDTDVDLDALSDYPLSGGLIANVVYEAASLALSEGRHKISQKDFLTTISQEEKFLKQINPSKKIGFYM